jgi:hypothetical protein
MTQQQLKVIIPTVYLFPRLTKTGSGVVERGQELCDGGHYVLKLHIIVELMLRRSFPFQ